MRVFKLLISRIHSDQSNSQLKNMYNYPNDDKKSTATGQYM